MPFNINWFDIVVLLIVGFGIWQGIRNGLSGELVGTTGFVLMIVVAIYGAPPLGNWLHDISGLAKEWATLIMFLLLGGLVMVSTILARNKIRKRMKQKRFSSAVENVGGGLAGMVRMLAIMTGFTILICLSQSDFWTQQIGEQSRFGAFVAEKTPMVAELVETTKETTNWLGQEIERRADPDIR